MDTKYSYSRMRSEIISSFLNTQKAQDTSQSSVCRCLFGPGDPELNKRVARESLKENEQLMSRKYNFDFATETPKKGEYEWEKENNVASIPEMYRTVKVKSPRVNTPIITRPIATSNRLALNATVTSSNTEHCDVSHTNSDLSVTVSSSQDKTSTSVQSTSLHTSPRKRQAEITDYFHAKKSRTNTKRRLDL